MAAGDPDMAGDELQAAIDRAQAKRQELTNSQTAGRQTGKVIAVLPNAAALYRRQVAEGLDGSPEEAAKARLLRREIFGGTYRCLAVVTNCGSNRTSARSIAASSGRDRWWRGPATDPSNALQPATALTVAAAHAQWVWC